MLERLDVALVSAVKQTVCGFGIFLLLAVMLDWIGDRLEIVARAIFGKGYDFVLLPGTMCRAAGEALGCIITGTKMSRSSFSAGSGRRRFEIDRQRLPVGTPIAVMKRMVILTGPIWFGCAVMVAVSFLAAGMGLLPDKDALLADGRLPGLMSYTTSLVGAALGMLKTMVSVWHWTSPFCILCLYLYFAIATKMVISRHELLGIFSGIIVVALLLFALNLVPGCGALLARVATAFAPYVFILHTILLFVFFLNIIFYVVLKLVAKLFGRKCEEVK